MEDTFKRWEDILLVGCTIEQLKSYANGNERSLDSTSIEIKYNACTIYRLICEMQAFRDGLKTRDNKGSIFNARKFVEENT